MSCQLILEANGQKYTFNPVEPSTAYFTPSNVIIKENEKVSLTVCTKMENTLPVFWLNDLEIKPVTDNIEILDDGFKLVRWGNEKWFINHFGYCRLSVILYENGKEKWFFFPYIEVVACKFNADNALQMIQYLESRLPEITQSCFSATSGRGDNQGQGKIAHPNIIIKEAQNCINVLGSTIPQIIKHPISRLETQHVVVPAEKAKMVSDKSLAWLCSHPDVLNPAWYQGGIELKIKNRSYRCSYLYEGRLEENCDLYENQVLVGMLMNMRRTLVKILEFYNKEQARFEKAGTTNDIVTIPEGYQRFDNLTARYGLPFCKLKVQQCFELLTTLNKLMRQIEILGPIRKIEGMPRLTTKFASFPSYRTVFETACRWYRLGATDLDGDSYLFSLKSIDWLYELYCLFRVIHALEDLGFKLFESKKLLRRSRNRSLIDSDPARYYHFLDPWGEKIELWYEPEIGCRRSDVSGLARIDWGLPFIPDFVLGFSYSNQPAKYAILDAKYSSKHTVMKKRLPDLAFKYLHKIGTPEGGWSPVYFLWALCTDQYNNPEEMFSLHSSSSLKHLPSLGTAMVRPGENDALEGLLDEIIGFFRGELGKSSIEPA